MSLQIGDSVIVNDGVKESDEVDFVVGGWQGRITNIVDDSDKDNPLLEVEWDSITVRQLPEIFVEDSYHEQIPWQKMKLRQSGLTKTDPRDEAGDVRGEQIEVDNRFFLGLMGEVGHRIAKILTGITFFTSDEAAQRWLNYFRNNVRLPLPVIVVSSHDKQVIKPDTIARITSFNEADTEYGIWVTLVYNTKKIDFPLTNAKTLKPDSPYSELLEDYKKWFDILDFKTQ